MKSIYERYGRENRLLSVIFLLCAVILIISASIAIPIYVRFFYYSNVDAYDIDEQVGMDREDVIEAYDDVLDYLTHIESEFKAGILPFSEEGRAHFEDCRVLFDINAIALIASLLGVSVLLILNKIGIIVLSRPSNRPLGYYAGLITLILFAVLGVLIAVDFRTAFVTFHKIFFPGKSNWMFDPATDPVIMILPSQFFMNCALLICSSIILVSVILVVKNARKREV